MNWRTLTIAGLLLFGGLVQAQPSERLPYTGTVYLYGEAHGSKKVFDRELELWQDHYRQGQRHLFVEYASYTAGFLNLWMHAPDDAILMQLYNDWKGTACHVPATLEFYRALKATCPETVFHGTDVGHQYDTTGPRYLRSLEDRGLGDSAEFRLTLEVIAQGRYYYGHQATMYREDTMVANFLRELATVGNQDVVGIYGSAHTDPQKDESQGLGPSMAKHLAHTIAHIVSDDLSALSLDIDPLRVDTFVVGGRTYRAPFYGDQDIGWSRVFASRKFWRLEGAYENLKTSRKTGDVLPYNNYPMKVELGQVYRIEYTAKDGQKTVTYYITDGRVWKNLPSSEEIVVN